MLEAAGVPKTPATLGGAFIAGFFASACSLPFDFVKVCGAADLRGSMSALDPDL